MTISQRIFEELRKKGKSQKDLADATGISTSTISSWKKHGTNPLADSICSIAQFLDVSPEYLLSGEDKNKSSLPELTENEQAIVRVFKELTDTQQGEIIGRAKTMAEQNGDVYLRKENVS